jgi:hypothetical protein
METNEKRFSNRNKDTNVGKYRDETSARLRGFPRSRLRELFEAADERFW